MPRSLQDIIDHADRLADFFEHEFDPEVAQKVPVGELRLRHAVIDRARIEQHLAEAVIGARAEGLSWERIGQLLGTSGQAAHERYRSLVPTD